MARYREECPCSRRKSKRGTKSSVITKKQIVEYIAKKSEKKAMKVGKKLKSQAISEYSSCSNPFGDSNLGENFVWRKKIERDVFQGRSFDISVKSEKRRRKERMAELEKVKKRREERALEKVRHEEEMALLARERTRAEYQDWEKREEEFHFDQSKLRSEIRSLEGRMKPIDILSKNLNVADDFDLDLNEPYMVFKGLTVKQMEELRDDIKMHLDMDRATQTRIEFWEAMIMVSTWELAEGRKRNAIDRAKIRGEEPPSEILAEDKGLHSSVEADVKNLLEGKSSKEIEFMRQQIEFKMESGIAKNVEYWEAILKRLQIYKAKASLKEIHTDMLRRHLERLEHPMESVEVVKSNKDTKCDEEKEDFISNDMAEDQQPDFEQMEKEPTLESVEEHEAGSFSPQLLLVHEDEEAVDPETDRAELIRKREAVMEEHEGKAAVGDEMHDEYRPRKPKYFYRVHTGYEWNKYNQTHYDHENPPPKEVQGHTFNIFYPDLVDKTKAPTYTIEKDGDGETCTIRFHAGPPYEDIAFRIVNKEWEYSRKKGFKCTFELGIMHLYVNLQRHGYRR